MPVKSKKAGTKSKSGKSSVRKSVAKKSSAAKSSAKKKAVKKTTAKKSSQKKLTSKKITTKKTASKKTTASKKKPNKISGKTVKKAAPKKKTVSRQGSKTTKKRVSKRKFQEIKKLLEARREEILKEVAGDLSSGLNSETISYPDLSDLASIESDRNFSIRIKERERRLLKKINLALEQIKNGSFGICESCGEEIGKKRLLARPVATLCIQCKTEAEREEKAKNL